MALSLYAKGLTTGEISAHFSEVIEEMNDWAVRPLEPVYAAIGVSLAGERDILGPWAGSGSEGPCRRSRRDLHLGPPP